MLKKTVTVIMVLLLAALMAVNWRYLSQNASTEIPTAHLPWPTGQKKATLLWLQNRDSASSPAQQLKQISIASQAEVVGLTVQILEDKNRKQHSSFGTKGFFALRKNDAASTNELTELTELLIRFPKQVFWFHIRGITRKKQQKLTDKLMQQWRSHSPNRIWLSTDDTSITKEFEGKLPGLTTINRMHPKPGSKLIWDFRFYKLLPLPGEILFLPRHWLSTQEVAGVRRYLRHQGKELILWSRHKVHRSLYDLWLETENGEKNAARPRGLEPRAF